MQIPIIKSIELDSNYLDSCYAVQKSNNWCWAACISMFLATRHIYVTQEELVHRSFGIRPEGSLPDVPANTESITQNLNSCGIDTQGTRYSVHSNFHFGAPSASQLIHELENGYAVILGYATSHSNIGHIVLVTGVKYHDYLGRSVIGEVTVRDPSPEWLNQKKLGKTTYDGLSFAVNMKGFWVVRCLVYSSI